MGRIIEEALRNKDLPQEAKDALQDVADLERSKGHAVLHLMTLASTLDAKMKLLKTKGNPGLHGVTIPPHTGHIPAALLTVQTLAVWGRPRRSLRTQQVLHLQEAHSPAGPSYLETADGQRGQA